MNDYQFPKMIPELRAYLDHQETYRAVSEESYKPCGAAYTKWKEAGQPEGPLKAELEEERRKHDATLVAHREEGKRLAGLLPDGLLEEYHAGLKVWYCRDETATGEPDTHLSPSGRYKLVVTRHTTGPGFWCYSKGRIYNDSEVLIGEVCRNYSSFPFEFVEEHPNGHDYLVCGEDYQGQTVVELDTGKRRDYLPKAAVQGWGFCWASYTASPSKRTLSVCGCYWACPYEVWFVDFSDPMEGLPILLREADAEQFFGWTGPDSCEIGRCYDVVAATGKREEELTDAELDELEKLQEQGQKGLWKLHKDRITWTRPTDEEAARAYIREIIDWISSGREVASDLHHEAVRHLARLPNESEREELRKVLATAKVV